jgi:multidrug efflux pump subunit AcrA (membrane-fusion protein)
MRSIQQKGLSTRALHVFAVAAAISASTFTTAIAQTPPVPVTDSQERSLGIRVVHPIPSRTDQTLAFPAQIVIPTAQLWVVSAPVAGMVASLSVARGDHVAHGQTIAMMQSPNFVSLQREYLHAVEQQVLLEQQVRRNTQLAETKALAQRLLEASQTEARQASVAVAERRQMLRLNGM